jgi:SSS family solute:Na+ symporter
MKKILSKKSVQSFIGLSLLMNMPLLYEPQLIASYLVTNNLPGIWIAWSGIFSLATALIFFSGLWEKLPVKTENDFSLFRYSGWSAKLLVAFRAVFLGVFIIPLIMAQMLVGFASIISIGFSIPIFHAYLIVGALLTLAALLNDIRKRIMADAITAIVFIVLLSVFCVGLFIERGSPWNIASKINSAGFSLHLFPSTSDSFNWVNLAVLLCLQWWLAALCDLPDMEGQKLLNASDKKGARQFMTGILLFMFLQVFLMFIPLYAMGEHAGEGWQRGEDLIAVFLQHLSGWVKWSGLIMLLLAFVSLSANYQLWSASMVVGQVQKLQLNALESIMKFLPRLWMIAFTWLSVYMAIRFESLLGIVKHLFVISAGVGPVFILRWFWKRINAWSQLTAMLSSLVYSFIYHQLLEHSNTFKNILDELKLQFLLNDYSLELILLGTLVTATWLIVTFLTTPVNKDHSTRFFQVVGTQVKAISKQQWLHWMIACCSFFLIKLGWWALLCGQLIAGVLFLMFAGLGLLMVIQHVRKRV